MAKYYVQSGWVRLILDAPTAQHAAARALTWSCTRQAEVFAEPAGDLIRDAEALVWQLGEQIRVTEQGFCEEGGEVFETFELLLGSENSARPRDLPRASACRRISKSRSLEFSQGEDCHAS